MGPLKVSGGNVFSVEPNSLQLSHESGLGTGRLIAFGPNAATPGSLRFTTSSSDGFRQNDVVFTKDGYMGIGTTSPGAKLDVRGPLQVSGGNLFAVAPNSVQLSHESGLGAARLIAFGPDASTFGSLYLTVASSTGALQSNVGMTSTGLGVGTTTPMARLHVDGDAIISGTVSGANITAKYQDVGGMGGRGRTTRTRNSRRH